MDGIAACGSCGETMTALGEPEEDRYACPRHVQGGMDDCPVPPILAEHMHRRVMQSMLDELLTGETLRKFVRSVRRGLEEELRQGSANLENQGAEMRRWNGAERAYQIDEGRITMEARNPDTYLRFEDPGALRQMFHGAIEQVRVNPDGMTVRYILPLPDGTHERDI